MATRERIFRLRSKHSLRQKPLSAIFDESLTTSMGEAQIKRIGD